LTVAPVVALVLSLLLFVSWVVCGIKLKLLAAFFRVRLALAEATALYVTSVFLNYLLFQVGFASKGLYLKHRYGLSYPAFASLSSFQAVAVLLVAGVAGPILILISKVPFVSAWHLALFFAGLGAVGILAFLLQTRLASLKLKVWNPVSAFGERWGDIRSQPGLIAGVIAVELFGMGLYGVRLYVAFWALGHEVSLTACWVMALSGVLSGFVNLTPGSLVIQETVAAFVAMAFGVAFQVGLAAAFLDRAVDLAWSMAAGSLLTYLLAQRFGEMALLRQAPPIQEMDR
jgi:uncharacterized membrane protein YbhN (UPF0104 family)